MALVPTPLLLLRYLNTKAAIVAGAIGKDVPEITDGITSGPGNQGSAATVLAQGEAGTSATRGSIPMTLPSVLTG